MNDRDRQPGERPGESRRRSPNLSVADLLRQGADLLEQQRANPFRISAYRRAAETISGLSGDLRDIFDRGGPSALIELPNVGRGIAAAIAEILSTGRWAQLERLRGDVDPERLFRTVPGVGERLARVIHDTLHVDSLEALETAAYDGRLEKVPGVGPRRSAAIRASLSKMLSGIPRRREGGRLPSVGTVLDIDTEYRRLSASGELPAITPRRFNPDGRARIPVLHTVRDGWHFTVLFSNTPRAHELGMTRDWVVIYFYDDDHREAQHTVVTETHGPLEGRRVIRGRERECLEYVFAGSRPAGGGAPPAGSRSVEYNEKPERGK